MTNSFSQFLNSLISDDEQFQTINLNDVNEEHKRRIASVKEKASLILGWAEIEFEGKPENEGELTSALLLAGVTKYVQVMIANMDKHGIHDMMGDILQGEKYLDEACNGWFAQVLTETVAARMGLRQIKAP